MPTYKEQKTLPYTAVQMFDLVMDVERYPEFLPWCLDCRVQKRGDGFLVASLVIGYKVFREWFTSRVDYQSPNLIKVRYVSGPLKHLSNVWKIKDNGDGSSTIDFFVEFEFKNIVFDKVLSVFFNDMVHKMVDAFVKRAEHLYGVQGTGIFVGIDQ